MFDEQYKNKITLWIDNITLFSLAILIFVLPIAHTATIRSFAMFTPLLLLIVRYFLIKDLKLSKTSFEWQFVAFFVVAAISVFTSIDTKTSLKEIWRDLVTPILIFYTVYFSIKEEKNVFILLRVLFLTSFIFSLFSFYDFYKKGGEMFSAVYRAGGLRDPRGGEAAALYHTMVIPLIFWCFFYTKEKVTRIALVVLLLVNLLALHMTFTRAAYIAIATQGFFIIYMLLMKKRWVSAVAVFTIIISIASFYLEKKMLRELQTAEIPSIKSLITMNPEEISTLQTTSSTLDRIAMWKTAINEISKNPFYPHGYGRFLFGNYVKNQSNKHFIRSQVHNTFIGITFELGIQGLIIFLWMICSFFCFFYKQWKNSEKGLSHYISAALITMMTGYWVNNFFGSFDADESKRFFMILLGLGIVIVKILPKEKTIIKQNV